MGRESRLDRRCADRDDAACVRWLFPDDPVRRRRRDRVLLVLGIVLAVVLVLRAARKGDSVLVRNQEWGARFVERQDPYVDTLRGGRLHGPYPPSYAIVCAPLSMLPTGVARVVWALAQIGALAATFVLLRRWTARGWPQLAPHVPVLFALALILASRYVLRDMAGGGGNLLYGTCALWGIELALGGSAVASAFLLALPLVLKPNLAPLVLALPLRGRWRAFGVTIALALVLAWLPGMWFGASGWSELWSRWGHDVAAYSAVDDLSRADQVPEGFPVDDDGMNQSLRAALGRIAGDVPGLARWSARVGALLAILAAAWACARARGTRAEILGVLAMLPASLLASPIAWKAHHAVLLPLFALLAASALERRRWSALATFLVSYWIACGVLSEELVGKAGKAWLQRASVVTWWTIAMLAATLARARRPDGPDCAESAAPRAPGRA